MKREIKIVRCEDHETIAKMDRVCFGKKYAMKIRDIRKDTWWVARVNGAIAAFCGARMLKDGTCYFTRAGTLPEFRGIGLQKEMIALRKQYGSALGAEFAITYTSMFNCASVNNLIGGGFRLYRPKRKWEGAGFLYWRCAL